MIYVIADLHGCPIESFITLLDRVRFTDEDTLYVLGDVIDRGKDGLKLLRWMMRKPNVKLIMGNHEAMMLANKFLFEEITEEKIAELMGGNFTVYNTWLRNGGAATIEAFSGVPREMIPDIVGYIKDAPLYAEVDAGGKHFILTHAGLGNFRKEKKLNEYNADELLWHRPEITDRYFDGAMVVFGHTPTVYYGKEYKGKAIITDTWIDIDVGAGSNIGLMILRLDDMKEIYL